MNELRLEYQKETGHQVKIKEVVFEEYIEEDIKFWAGYEDGNSITQPTVYNIYPEEYVEWLEKYIEDATKQAKELLNHNIFYKRK